MSTKEKKNGIGKYKFIKTIGEGTFGKVKLSIHLPTKEYVAIKILEKSRIQDKEELERVQKEIKYLKLLNHPNIIQIYEVIENEEFFYIVMEYVSGGELFNYILDKEKLSEKESSFFFTQLIYGIKEIHKHKICHRDIKPENLLLTEQKIIKIIDFGLSNEYTDVLDSQCGSPCYAAPEMIRGMKYNGLMVDLWACGIILFAMLCGYLPFDDKDNLVVFRKILQCKLEFPDEDETILSNEAKDLISRIITPNPQLRIKINEVLKHPFLKSGIEEYNKIIKSNPIFNQHKIIIDYMVNKLKCANGANAIYKLIKENRHNGITTTYKLLKKQIIEGKFDYNYNKDNSSISPIKNVKVKININNKENKNNIEIKNKNNNEINNLYIKKNQQNITATLRKSIKENNIILDKNKFDKMNRTRSTDSTKKSSIKDLNIHKKNQEKKYIQDNALFGLKNNNLLIKDTLKKKALYQELITKNKNINNFKREIDTSVSKEKKKPIISKKIIPKSPPIYPKNPFVYEQDTYNYRPKKIIYYPNYLLNKRNEQHSADTRIKPKKKVRYIHNPIVIRSRNNELTPISNNIYKTRCGLSADEAGNKLTKLKKNPIKINNYNYAKNTYTINNDILNKNKGKIISDYNNNITLLSNHISNDINYKRINIDKNIQTARTPINLRRNNIDYTIRSPQYKKIPYYIPNKNNYNTIETSTNNNYLIKNNNNDNKNPKINNHIPNTNIIYNNFIVSQNTNYNYNTIKTEPKSNNIINNDKLKPKNKIIYNNIKYNNIKYIPLASKTKNNPIKPIDQLLNRHERVKTFNLENIYYNKNNIIPNKNLNNNNNRINNFYYTNYLKTQNK